MKKRIFKDWVTYTILFIQTMLILFISGEMGDDIALVFAIKSVMILVFFFNHFLLARHSNFFTGEF